MVAALRCANTAANDPFRNPQSAAARCRVSRRACSVTNAVHSFQGALLLLRAVTQWLPHCAVQARRLTIQSAIKKARRRPPSRSAPGSFDTCNPASSCRYPHVAEVYSNTERMSTAELGHRQKFLRPARPRAVKRSAQTAWSVMGRLLRREATSSWRPRRRGGRRANWGCSSERPDPLRRRADRPVRRRARR